MIHVCLCRRLMIKHIYSSIDILKMKKKVIVLNKQMQRGEKKKRERSPQTSNNNISIQIEIIGEREKHTNRSREDWMDNQLVRGV